MSDFLTRTAKLIPKSKRIKPFPGYATAYHYETEGTEADGLGNLYIAIEVLTVPKQAEAVVDLVIESAGNAYYNADTPKATILERFEKALKAVNQALANHTNAGNASWVGRLSAVIAVLADSELHVTQAGSAEAYLFRGNVTSHITSELTTKNQQRPINTFANIATGSLQLHDRLIIATPAFFHAIQQPTLKTTLIDNTANTAVKKLSDLIGQSDEANRVAAIIIEVLTPELLALQARPEEPDNVEVGQTDKPLEVAKAFALPVAKNFANTSITVGAKAASHAKTTLLPRAKQTGFKIASFLRNRLRTRRGQIELAAIGLFIILVFIAATFAKQNRKVSAAQIAEYNDTYVLYTSGQQLLDQGDRTNAHAKLDSAQARLTKLSQSVNQAKFDTQLQKHPHPEDDPASINKLLSKIKDLQTQIEGIFSLTPVILSDFGQFKNAKPTKMTVVGSKLVIVDSQNNSAIYGYDFGSKTLAYLNRGNSQLGKVLALTPTSDNSGAYLLTEKSGIWLVRTLDGNLTQVSLNIGDWPKGRSIATYNNSLYMLSADSSELYKFSPTSAGFAAPSSYFSDSSSTTGTTSIAIDGSIYLSGSGGMRRFTAGKLDQSQADIPQTLQNPSQILIIDNGDRLVLLDGTTGHLGLLSNNPNSISFTKQLVLKSFKNVAAIASDAKSTNLFVLADGKLVSVSLPQ